MTETAVNLKRVLVVEDDTDAREILQKMLTAEGYQVSAPARVETAASEAKKHLPNVVLMDIMLPGGLDGFDMVRVLRRSPTTAKTPIIMMTARRKREDIVHSAQLGVAGFILKPIEKDTLLTKIKAVLEKAEHGSAAQPAAGDDTQAD